jgi:hypothetical protein
MRGVNLNQFQFDYDLTWMAFLMNANGKIYGRYGGRDAGPADRYLSLASLKHAMQAALVAYRRDPDGGPAGAVDPPRTVEQYPAAIRQEGCIHCHMVYQFSRQAERAAGQWRRDKIWVYPLPENVGITVTRDRQDQVQQVAPGSAAEQAGLQAGDRLRELNGVSIASLGDIQYALDRAPASGQIPVSWERAGQVRNDQLPLAPGWRKSDISWRSSMWSLEPSASVYGNDLKPEEKQSLGLPANGLAFRQGDYVPPAAKAAGIRAKDIIHGIDGQSLPMNMLHFNAYVRLNYQVGDRIVYDIIRDGQRLKVPMVLPAHD